MITSYWGIISIEISSFTRSNAPETASLPKTKVKVFMPWFFSSYPHIRSTSVATVLPFAETLMIYERSLISLPTSLRYLVRMMSSPSFVNASVTVILSLDTELTLSVVL